MTEVVPGFFSYQLISFLFEFRKSELGFLSFANTKILTDRIMTLKSKLISSSNKLKETLSFEVRHKGEVIM